MKTNITHLFMAVAMLAVATTVNARSWRIHHDVAMKPDFTDINAAMASDNVQSGDTLYLDPGCALTSYQTINKCVTVIGTGYFRTDAPHSFAIINDVLEIDCNKVKVEGVIVNYEILIEADNVSIERCKCKLVNISRYWYIRKHTTIRQCFIETGISGGRNGAQDGSCSQFAQIENCIFRGGNAYIDDLGSPTITNNIFYTTNNRYTLNQINGGIIQNNIFINQADATKVFSNITNTTITNNVIVSSEENYPTYASNNIFVDEDDGIITKEGSYTEDKYYQLTENSPAKGYGILNGVPVDCGPFGGPNPYVLNGLPKNTPYYTKAVVDSRSKNGKINVSLNIKMQDE